MRNMLLGILLSAFVFGVLSWATSRKTVHAEVLTTPPAGRFQLVQLHPSAGVEWSGILDTETGCTWAYNPHDNTEVAVIKAMGQKLYPNQETYPQLASFGFYLAEFNSAAGTFALVNYDAREYMSPGKNKDGSLDFDPLTQEVSRVQTACAKARLQALDAAGGH